MSIAVIEGATGIGPQQRGQDTPGSRLSRPVRPKQAKRLTRRTVKTNVAYGVKLSFFLTTMAQTGRASVPFFKRKVLNNPSLRSFDFSKKH